MVSEALKKNIGDPSKSSLREEAISCELGEYEENKFPISREGFGKNMFIYVDEKTGEKFHKIFPSSSAPLQKLVSLMLKGVINVSDIVKIGKNYYSHEQNFDHLDSSNKDIKAEIKADFFIINRIFEDYDHGYYLHNNSQRIRTEKKISPNSLLEHHNLLVDEKKGRLNFFDFGANKLKNYYSNEVDFLALEKEFEEDLANRIDKDPKRNEIIDILKKKVNILISLYSDNEFERFKKIIQKSGVQLGEEEQKVFFDYIKNKLNVLNKVLNKIN